MYQQSTLFIPHLRCPIFRMPNFKLNKWILLYAKCFARCLFCCKHTCKMRGWVTTLKAIVDFLCMEYPSQKNTMPSKPFEPRDFHQIYTYSALPHIPIGIYDLSEKGNWHDVDAVM